ncbi:uncharacterized protein DUF6682 [Cupriavidus metallidurans]|uniref:DUF6682 family protein n=1 Tax=Cupriavidus metallidurans TaxID=119219 RepID=UPI000493A2AD|nr:DUF6682 family protein [Cupriavidus metallidurans]MDE4918269.1 hypothetical protein [Cupriavidus metallidurans]
MATVQQVIDRGRVPLNDADKVRYTDDDLLNYLNDGMAEIYTKRPDLRFGKFGVATDPIGLTDKFPLSQAHEVAIKHYIVYRSELTDDENVNENRAAQTYKLFEKAVATT